MVNVINFKRANLHSTPMHSHMMDNRAWIQILTFKMGNPLRVQGRELPVYLGSPVLLFKMRCMFFFTVKTCLCAL